MKKGLEAVINTKTQTLELHITGRIYHGWSANDFRWEIERALKEGIQKGVLYLNTEGGSVFEASEIVNQLKRLPKVEVQAGALVASAGTYIMCHFSCKAFATSQFMIHKPLTYFEGNIDQMRTVVKLLENLTQQYRSVYAKRFGKSDEEIDALWQQDYWLTAQEAMELGLVTEIIDGEPEINESIVEAIQAYGGKISVELNNKIKNEKKENKEMDRNVLIASLGMPADATDEQIQARISELKNKEKDNQTTTQTRAEKLVNQAIFDKKITADKQQTYVKLAVADYDNTKLLLDEMQVVTPASQQIVPKGSAVIDRSGWTIGDYLEKDPEALEKLIEENPQKARELNALYAKQK